MSSTVPCRFRGRRSARKRLMLALNSATGRLVPDTPRAASRTRPPGIPPGKLAPSRATGISASTLIPVRDAHALEHPHHVFGRHIARRAGSKRAAAQAPERSIEHADALPERGVDVGEPKPIS